MLTKHGVEATTQYNHSIDTVNKVLALTDFKSALKVLPQLTKNKKKLARLKISNASLTSHGATKASSYYKAKRFTIDMLTNPNPISMGSVGYHAMV